MPEYAFDIELFAAVRVNAPNEATARQMLAEAFEAADTNFGAWPDGSPILGEASLSDLATPSLFEVDGEPVDDEGEEG